MLPTSKSYRRKPSLNRSEVSCSISVWQYAPAHQDFQPLEYLYQNINDDKVRNVKLLFDWNKNRVTNIINGDPWHMALSPGVQDKLLFQLKMMQDLKNGSQLKYSVADGGKIKEYIIENQGNETLEISLGRFNASRRRPGFVQ